MLLIDDDTSRGAAPGAAQADAEGGQVEGPVGEPPAASMLLRRQGPHWWLVSAVTAFHCGSLPFTAFPRVSTAFHCLSSCFHCFSLPTLDLSLPFTAFPCVSTAFHRDFTASHCLSLPFPAVSLRFHYLSLPLTAFHRCFAASQVSAPSGHDLSEVVATEGYEAGDETWYCELASSWPQSASVAAAAAAAAAAAPAPAPAPTAPP